VLELQVAVDTVLQHLLASASAGGDVACARHPNAFDPDMRPADGLAMASDGSGADGVGFAIGFEESSTQYLFPTVRRRNW